MFSTNSLFLYGLAVCVILFVLAQSIFFLVRAYRRGMELGMGAEKNYRIHSRIYDCTGNLHSHRCGNTFQVPWNSAAMDPHERYRCHYI